MEYQSTRDPSVKMSASQVIMQGISPEGGLFVPVSFPDLKASFENMAKMDYQELARFLFSLFLTDFTQEEIEDCVKKAYSPEKFGGKEPVRLVPLTGTGENKYLLELWHGPTCAFKDMALQILPHFLGTALKKQAGDQTALILVATSGDTGKAALEGFKDVEHTRILVFYPKDGVSPMQQLQMQTQEGENVFVCAVEGNFDDAQSGVKAIFTDEQIKARLKEHGVFFSSANSINWGRLLPQLVYYFYSYFELYRTKALPSLSDRINIVVPTGNFGNILAAYYAARMGLPVKKFICASNANRVLTDFISTGVYDRRREFYTTASPSMDILISSNLERLLFALCGENHQTLSGWMNELSQKGCYQVGDSVKEKLQVLFFGGSCDDVRTAAVIQEMLSKEQYLCDPHTAVAVDVYRQYLANSQDNTPTVIASTADPYKFASSVLQAIGQPKEKDEFENLIRLEEFSGVKAPLQIKQLKEKSVRFTEVASKDQLRQAVLRCLPQI